MLERRRGCDSDCSVWQHRAPLVWEEEKDVLCFVYDRVAEAATGNLWACRQAFSGCSTASQPLSASFVPSIVHRKWGEKNLAQPLTLAFS